LFRAKGLWPIPPLWVWVIVFLPSPNPGYSSYERNALGTMMMMMLFGKTC
jgi:hypothetical protein